MAVALAAGWPAPALARQDLESRYGDVLEQCYTEITDTPEAIDPARRDACIGRMSEVCMEREEGGETTLGIVRCLEAEARLWDRKQEAQFRDTLDWLGQADVADAATMPQYAVRAEKLRVSQQAWAAFRDAECALDYAIWGAGSIRQIAAARCDLRLTAERTFDLFEKGEPVQ